MKRTFLILSIALIFSSVNAQIQRNTGQMTGTSYAGGTVESFTDFVPEEGSDNQYLSEQWAIASIDLVNGPEYEVKNVPARYNVVRNQVEVRFESDVKVAQPRLIEKFKWLKTSGDEVVFVNGGFINRSKDDLYEVLFLGDKYVAYVDYEYEKLMPDYNPQFDVGSRTERIVIREEFYLYDKEKQTTTEFQLKTRSFAKLFDSDEKISKIIKSTKVKEKGDVAEILEQVDP